MPIHRAKKCHPSPLDWNMAQTTEQKESPYLPLELWQQVFFQHTSPQELWTAGRQVCSEWRSEIPKVFAKKYLENPDMVRIYFDFGKQYIEHSIYFMGAEMAFDRYEESAKERCVFKELTTTSSRDDRVGEELRVKYENTKFGVWRSGLSTYLGGGPGARVDGGRFDLPIHQIWIKESANDSELPRLEYDFQKREISFEWEGMFTQSFCEAAMLADWQRSILTETVRFVPGRKSSMAAVAKASRKRGEVLRKTAREIRRHRIRKWYRDNYGWEFPEQQFDEQKEDKALAAIKFFESYGDFRRCAEDKESLEWATEAYAKSQMSFETMEGVLAIRKNRHNDTALMVMFMERARVIRREEEEDDGNDEEHDKTGLA